MGKRHVPPAAVDLFCGAGGLSYGIQESGMRICAGIDVDPACRHPFETNVGAKFYEMDAMDLTCEFVGSLYPNNAKKVLIGCAPCQPFSTYSHNATKNRWRLLSKFGDLVEQIRPEIVTMENVPGLVKYPVFKKYVGVLKRCGYFYKYGLVNCADYGVPQGRKRLVLLASRLGRIDMPSPTHKPGTYRTVRDAIGRLKRIGAGDRSSRDRIHVSSRLSEKNAKRIRQSIPGGTWRDWDAELMADCHVRKTGKSFMSVYGRMRWDSPGPTITTQFHGFGSGRFGHPEQHRAISLREGALLQTFPRRYSFVPDTGDVCIGTVARLIGNAVPVKLGAAIGRCIMRHIEEYDSD